MNFLRTDTILFKRSSLAYNVGCWITKGAQHDCRLKLGCSINLLMSFAILYQPKCKWNVLLLLDNAAMYMVDCVNSVTNNKKRNIFLGSIGLLPVILLLIENLQCILILKNGSLLFPLCPFQMLKAFSIKIDLTIFRDYYWKNMVTNILSKVKSSPL